MAENETDKEQVSTDETTNADNKSSTSLKYGKEPPWGDFFEKLLKFICDKYYNNRENLIVDEKEISVDPLTFISFLIGKKKRLSKFLDKHKVSDEVIINKLKEEYKDKSIPNTTLFRNLSDYKTNTIDHLWKLSLLLKDKIYDGEAFEHEFNSITSETDNSGRKIATGIATSNLSIMLYMCKPNYFYPLDNECASDILDKINNSEIDISENLINEIPSIKSALSDTKKVRDYNMFEKLQKLCKDKKEKIGTPYQFYKSVYPNSVEDEKENEEDNTEGEDNKMNPVETQPLNQILYGPPGTGKTYNTVIKAMEIIDNSVIQYDEKNKDIVTNYDSVKNKFDELKKAGRIEFITFHQSYGYEDFIEGIKPDLEDAYEIDGEIKYKIFDGIFKRVAFNALYDRLDIANNKSEDIFNSLIGIFKEKYSNGDELETSAKKVKFILEDYTKDGITILAGKKKSKVTISFKKLKEIFNGKTKPEKASDLKGIGSNNNPYYYAIYKMFAELQVEDKLSLIKKYYAGKIELKDIKESKPYVLIIDEINRGNISKILGELITLLEDDKRENFSVKLPYSHEEFTVPKNLYIIGTMNTADRSIALMDTALRRRFEFVEMMPKPDLLNFKVEDIDIKEMLETMNARIEALYDREHTIGHAFFMPLKENGTIKELGKIFKNKIIPLLQEYFYDDYSKIQLVLGDNQDNVVKFIDDESIEKNKLFKGNTDKVRIPNDKKKYSINNNAFEKVEAYIKIYE